MTTSLNGLYFLLGEEAIVLTTYDDGAGVLTIGAGHTAKAGDPAPTPGMTIELIEAINLLRLDLRKYEREVDDKITVPLSQHQFDALVSWHYNTGAVFKSTLTELINSGDYDGAADQLLVWNKIGQQVSAGLSARRVREREIFVNANYAGKDAVLYDTRGGPAKIVTRQEVFALLKPKGGGGPDAEETMSTTELLENPASKLLPRHRPHADREVIRAALRDHMHLVPDSRRDDAVYVLAVRDYYLNSLGKQGVGDRNLYDDAIFVVAGSEMWSFNANTDPSKYRARIAQLKARQAVCYKPGPHGLKNPRGPYPAFRQNSPVTVLRDGSGEDCDAGKAWFWINLHRGGNNETSSAGCQTVPPHQWDEFRRLVNRLLKDNRQDDFYYILITNADLPAAADAVAASQRGTTSSRFEIRSVSDMKVALAFLGGEVGRDDDVLDPTTERSIEVFLSHVNLAGIGKNPATLYPAVQAVYYAFGGK